MPWRELVAPAIELAREGVELTRPQAHLHAILDLILRHTPEGRAALQPAGRRRLAAGRHAPAARSRGHARAHRGTRARRRSTGGELGRDDRAHRRAGGGRLTVEDLAAYGVEWREPVRVPYLGHEVMSNPPPSSGGVLIAYGLALLERIGAGARHRPGDRALVEVMREQRRVRDDAFAEALHAGGLAAEAALRRGARGGGRARSPAAVRAREDRPPAARRMSPPSTRDGNAASLSSSTGSGSGVIVPGTGIQLNNMLGEYDLVAGAPAEAGHRLTSMMAPTVVLAGGRPRLVVGSAGSVRLRGAIMQVIVNVLVHGDGVAAAIDAPRVHVEDSHVHCEGGFDPAELDRVETWTKNLVRWRRPNLYFGGTNAVELLPDGSLAAAGDARRGGDGVVVG